MSAVQTMLNIQGALQTVAGGVVNYAPPQIVNQSSVAQAYDLALTATPVLVTLPANTIVWGLTPPAGNIIAISHKWAVGDTGGQVNPTYGVPVMAVNTSLTFYLWSASPVTVTLWSA